MLILLALIPLVPPLLVPGAGVLVSFAIVAVSLMAVRASRGPTLAMIDRGWGRTLAMGLVGGAAIALAMEAIDPLLERLTGSAIDLSAYDAVRGNVGNYVAMLAIGIGVGGILEELTFRGFVVGWGSRLLGDRAAPWLVVLSAAAFGFAHLYQGWAGVLSTGLTGLLLGILYLASDRKLAPAMIAHALINVVGITKIYLG